MTDTESGFASNHTCRHQGSLGDVWYVTAVIEPVLQHQAAVTHVRAAIHLKFKERLQ
jgi:hypothetical protein